MPNRRDFLLAAGAAALSGALSPGMQAQAASEHWPPYRDTLSIDGESGVRVLEEEGLDAAAAAKELAAVRASGLGATLLQVAGSGAGGLTEAGLESSLALTTSPEPRLSRRDCP